MSKQSNLRVAVAGASGRMGRELLALLANGVAGLSLGAASVRRDSEYRGQDASTIFGGTKSGVLLDSDLNQDDFDVLVDFTHPALSLENTQFCRTHGKSLVIGTTGFDAEQSQFIERAAAEIPMVVAPNMSVGVNLLFQLLRQTTSAIGAVADIEITETHHRDKLDAPSGTALKMGAVIAEELGVNLDDIATFSRDGQREPRQRGSIGFTSLRAGDVIGDHTALFAIDGERIEVSHKASSRDIYAKGALRAARWLCDQPAGLYGMRDVLGLD